MKQIYRIGDDLFVLIAFISLVVAIVTRLLGITNIIYGIRPVQLLCGSAICLLFSVALSLRDMAYSKE